jgi:hypothetical protein
VANRKNKSAVKAAPKATHRRHAKKPGWLRKAVAQTFTSMLAPLLVGVALQCIQGHHLTSSSKAVVTTSTVSARQSATMFDVPSASRDVTQFRVNDERRTSDTGTKSY